MNIVLQPKTRKGKNRIQRAAGADFTVTKICDRVAFDERKGPWWLCERGKELFWILKQNDDNFTWEDA